MMIRQDPFRELDRLASMVFDRARTWPMPMDAYRRGDDWIVQLDLPGVETDSIDLTVEGNVLSVTAHRSFDRTEVDELLVSERPQGVLNRQVFLGEGLDTDRMAAEYSNGVLMIRVPVLESARPRRVPIAIAGNRQEAIEATASA